MIPKSEIHQAVTFLLNSARNRDTSQGVLVYTKILEMLDAASDEQAVVELLGKLNRSLEGMEAHGHFTEQEFERVILLRNAEA
jgi:hypothetical protein